MRAFKTKNFNWKVRIEDGKLKIGCKSYTKNRVEKVLKKMISLEDGKVSKRPDFNGFNGFSITSKNIRYYCCHMCTPGAGGDVILTKAQLLKIAGGLGIDVELL
jgi:hypothetical protein